MDNGLILEVKKKREFSGLPDSIVEAALEKHNSDVKNARSFLRKYFGVFLTNKVLKGKDVLRSHKSSANRDYEKVYSRILKGFEGDFSILDLGCGAGGFSYPFLEDFGEVRYVGVEAAGQIVDSMKSYFGENDFDAEAICGDLMDLDFVLKILKKEKSEVVFLFNVIDALEKFEKDYSRKLILSLFENGVKRVVISNPIKSISGKSNFRVERKWLEDFLSENFNIVDKFVEGFEEFLVVEPK